MKLKGLIAVLALALIGVSTASAQVPKAFLNGMDDLRALCQNPNRFGLQQPPASLEITCNSVEREWVQVGTVTIEQPRSSEVLFEVTSDKSEVFSLVGDIEMGPTQVTCPVLEQIERNFSATLSVPCAEIVEFQGEFTEYCADALAAGTDDSENFLVDEVSIEGTRHALCGQEGQVLDELNVTDQKQVADQKQADQKQNGDD